MYTVNEALDEILESDNDIDSANIYLESPDATEDTDCDSGDEDGIGASVDNLSGNQLKAGCSVIFRTRDGRQFAHDVEDDSSSSETEPQNTTDEIELPSRKKKKFSVSNRVWRHTDLHPELQMTFEINDLWISDRDLTPLSIFELFLMMTHMN